jgi:hypothetical protein
MGPRRRRVSRPGMGVYMGFLLGVNPGISRQFLVLGYQYLG